jgi:hypothetical protein
MNNRQAEYQDNQHQPFFIFQHIFSFILLQK